MFILILLRFYSYSVTEYLHKNALPSINIGNVCYQCCLSGRRLRVKREQMLP